MRATTIIRVFRVKAVATGATNDDDDTIEQTAEIKR